MASVESPTIALEIFGSLSQTSRGSIKRGHPETDVQLRALAGLMKENSERSSVLAEEGTQ